MVETKVVNLTKESCDIIIDRRSKFGNPFYIGPDGDRMEVIGKYNQWIRGKGFTDFEQQQRKEALESLHQLKGKVLGCWCKPRACHGDILVELINALP